jgi:hypothetical protein
MRMFVAQRGARAGMNGALAPLAIQKKVARPFS